MTTLKRRVVLYFSSLADKELGLARWNNLPQSIKPESHGIETHICLDSKVHALKYHVL
jgi:hypothetical protein